MDKFNRICASITLINDHVSENKTKLTSEYFPSK